MPAALLAGNDVDHLLVAPSSRLITAAPSRRTYLRIVIVGPCIVKPPVLGGSEGTALTRKTPDGLAMVSGAPWVSLGGRGPGVAAHLQVAHAGLDQPGDQRGSLIAAQPERTRRPTDARGRSRGRVAWGGRHHGAGRVTEVANGDRLKPRPTARHGVSGNCLKRGARPNGEHGARRWQSIRQLTRPAAQALSVLVDRRARDAQLRRDRRRVGPMRHFSRHWGLRLLAVGAYWFGGWLLFEVFADRLYD
jgi:hypothetical protein